MKKSLFILFLMLFLNHVHAQVVAPLLTTMHTQKHKHCCCECSSDCDTVRLQYKPINHWSDVRHIIYASFNPTNVMNVNMVTADIEQNRVLMNLMSNTSSLYFGHEHIYRNFFIGGDIGGTFGNQYKQVTPELNMRMTGSLNIDINLGYHLVTTQHLRLYVMGKLQFAYAGLRLQRQLADIPQKSWNRFISGQNALLPYDRLVEGFLTTDRWGDELNMNSSFFASQLRVGVDYRMGKVKLGFHSGYSFQLSDKSRNWRYTYEFEEGDERRQFQVTNVPLSVSLDGLNVGFSVGYLFSDVVR